jgi:ribose 5-phosphate isomerase A
MKSIDSEQYALKIAVSKAALSYIPDNEIIGIGTGTTINCLIDLLATHAHKIKGVVSSSKATTKRLEHLGIEVIPFNDVNDSISVYIDGADEINPELMMIKGGGGALTQEKIIATAAKQFICIADASKYVSKLGEFPLPIEVLSMARSFVARELVKMGGDPVYRYGVVTDNGHSILDIHHLSMDDPFMLESKINQIPGVITNGLFAHRKADRLLLSSPNGIQEYT